VVIYFHAIIIANHDHAGEFDFVAKSAQFRSKASIRLSQFADGDPSFCACPDAKAYDSFSAS
jgi:hypothetical protein